MHLPVQKGGTSVRSLEKEPRKAAVDGTGSPSSPSSPGRNPREKPAKVLPCPRCESMNTKFCYYNNYSVNQPRHFCRQCQRYWTVGGTLRNVPVGGGSRKKNRHQRGEPYLRSSPGSGANPLAMASSGGQGGLQNMGFQQLLTQDISGFNFSQLPGFVPQNPYVSYPVDQSQEMYVTPLSSKSAQQEFPSMQVMYGNGSMHSQMQVTGNYYPDLAAIQGENPASVGVKTEFWGNILPHNQTPAVNQQVQGLWEQAKHTSATPNSVPDDVIKTGNSATLQAKSGGYDSSMLLHLGLNSRPQMAGKPSRTQESRGGNPTNGSPPHGSSTIEEEGSTPTNGYSNSGYEEGDTVSSMWHDMHDIFGQ